MGHGDGVRRGLPQLPEDCFRAALTLIPAVAEDDVAVTAVIALQEPRVIGGFADLGAEGAVWVAVRHDIQALVRAWSSFARTSAICP